MFIFLNNNQVSNANCPVNQNLVFCYYSFRNLKGSKEQEASCSKEVPVPAHPHPFNKLLELKKSEPDSGKEKSPRPSKKTDGEGEKEKVKGLSKKALVESDAEKPAARQSKKSEKEKESGEKTKKGKEDGEKEKAQRQSKKSEGESPRPDSADRFKGNETHEEKGVKVEDVPAYFPTDEEFQDPLKYISQIQKEAERYGMARIVPPRSFRVSPNI
jgi:hypothetical protein